jgi:RNA polymerase sigma-70 factor (ECF subfamily)
LHVLYTNIKQTIHKEIQMVTSEQRIRQELGRPRTRERMVRTARRLVHEHESEDVAHDAIVQALAASAGFREDAEVATWLYRIAFNAALMGQRSARRRQWRHAQALIDASWGPPPVPESQTILEAVEELHALHAAVARLPSAYREVIERCVFGEQGSDRVAGALGITPSAVRTRFARAREQLRALMETETEGS